MLKPWARAIVFNNDAPAPVVNAQESMMVDTVSDPRLAGLNATLGAVEALGTIFSLIDPSAWDSVARPSAHQVAQLFWLVGSRLEEAREELARGPTH